MLSLTISAAAFWTSFLYCLDIFLCERLFKLARAGGALLGLPNQPQLSCLLQLIKSSACWLLVHQTVHGADDVSLGISFSSSTVSSSAGSAAQAWPKSIAAASISTLHHGQLVQPICTPTELYTNRDNHCCKKSKQMKLQVELPRTTLRCRSRTTSSPRGSALSKKERIGTAFKQPKCLVQQGARNATRLTLYKRLKNASNGLVQKWLWSECSCLLYTSPSPRDRQKSRMPSSA